MENGELKMKAAGIPRPMKKDIIRRTELVVPFRKGCGLLLDQKSLY